MKSIARTLSMLPPMRSGQHNPKASASSTQGNGWSRGVSRYSRTLDWGNALPLAAVDEEEERRMAEVTRHLIRQDAALRSLAEEHAALPGGLAS